MNKYLEKVAGLPISAANLELVAKTYTKKGLDFANVSTAGKTKSKDLMKFMSTASRLNKNMPGNLAEAFQEAQVRNFK